MKNKKLQKNNKKKGSVIFVTIVLSITLVTLTYSMMLILTQQITFASLGKESLKALAAADSAIECAVYWDFEHPTKDRTVFSTLDSAITPFDRPDNEFCAGMELRALGEAAVPDITDLNSTDIPWHFIADGTESTFTFVTTSWSVNNTPFDMSHPCAVVSVHRDGYWMDITTVGYNNCHPDASRRISRAVYIAY